MLRSVVDTTDVILLALDAEGRIILINRKACDVLGWTQAELLGRNWIETCLPQRVREALQQKLESLVGGDPSTVENPIITKSGQERLIEWRNAAIYDDTGHVIGTLISGADVTERRKLEAQYYQAQKMEAVGRLAGGVAHDFNNLLTVILSYSDILLADLPPDDLHRPAIDAIRNASESASMLTRQLVVFSRQQVVQPRVMRLDELVANAARMLKRVIGEDVEFATELDSEAGAVKVDAGQMEQVIMNLAVNARDAMPNGGRLLMESKNVGFREAFSDGETSFPAGRYVSLTVSDNGIAMDAATKARVFEPFFTTKEPGRGTGLGLATVSGIVKQGGGYISLYSEPGKGTRFTIYLPRIDESADAPAAIAHAAPAPRGTETILVVEDEPAVRGIVRQVLERQGYRVLEVTDDESALDVASKHPGPIHLLLSDVVMPRMSGRVIADRFTKIRRDARILFVSGYTDDAIVHRGVLESHVQFLQKPFTPDALVRKVRHTLDQPIVMPRGAAPAPGARAAAP